MNTETNQVAVETNQTATTENTMTQTTKPTAAYLVKQKSRTRFSFGNAWMNAVLGGVVQDKDKLVAHAVKLKVGKKYDLSKLRFETLLSKVQGALMTEAPAPAAVADTEKTDA